MVCPPYTTWRLSQTEWRLITWDEIKRHFHGETVVDPCVLLMDVPPAVDPQRVIDDTVVPSNELQPKIHRSHRNVKEESKENKKLRLKEKSRERQHKYQQSVEKFKLRIDEETRLRCKWCSKLMSSKKALERHQRHLCTSRRGKLTAAATRLAIRGD